MVVEKDWNRVRIHPVSTAKYVYFITNSNRSCLQVGLTDSIVDFAKSFHKSQGILAELNIGRERIVYFEEFSEAFQAKERFAQVQKWTRSQKEKLLRAVNPNWTDLSDAIILEQQFFTTQKNPTIRPGFNYN
jgi:putative endonuclease